MNTIVFDLETKHLAEEVGGWANIDQLGLSAAVTYSVEEQTSTYFLEKDAEDLIDTLVHADRIVGYNVIRFDYEVLKPYGLMLDHALLEKTTDLLRHIQNTLGFRLRLDNLAEATLGERKSATGLLAVEWYREGKIDQLLEYCEQDVLVTYKLWQFGQEYGLVKYKDRMGDIRTIQVRW